VSTAVRLLNQVRRARRWGCAVNRLEVVGIEHVDHDEPVLAFMFDQGCELGRGRTLRVKY
jgi:hypothetical protein